MDTSNKSTPSFLRTIIDTGISEKFSIIEKRYLRVTNIAAILGMLFNAVWMPVAIAIAEITSAVWNVLLALMFSGVLVLNKSGRRVAAAVWLAIAAYVSVLVFLYLSGYPSGIATVCFLIIILPYMTFPRKARTLAHGFSLLACLTLIATVIFQSELHAHNEDMDPYLSQIVNISMTALICLAFIWSLSVLIDKSEDSLVAEQEKSDDLLYNILPVEVANDLKETGRTIPQRHENVTILFTDFKDFTELVASIPEITLVNQLNDIFGRFDEIVEETGVEKIVTIGDAYLAVGGIGEGATDHAVRCIATAQRMLDYLEVRNRKHEIKWRMRVGIHSGPIVAGVIGKKKFRYDLFGDTINTASRTESAGEVGRINISSSTYELVNDTIDCEYRGKIYAKGKGEMDMYFVR